MALQDNGVKVSISNVLIPSGFTAPAVTEFTDYEQTQERKLTILKSTVENADKATTLLNIINNATIGIAKQVNDLIAADYDETANTVEFFSELVEISNNVQRSTASDFYGNTAVSFTALVKIYVKTY